MGYLFLTGSTGLVGRYLLRNLLLAGEPVVTMVRPGRSATLQGILSYWEDQLGHALPRPVVLEGDLSNPDVVTDAGQRQWLKDHCDRILNCAASMTFREDKRGEPFRTNVEGTKNILNLCRNADIRQFHHVSTAYICGLRQGQILESDIDLGQTLGNVYEQSKLAAEKLIRSADFLDQRTFYRPASVVGDSKSGYVTSFHGFYLPLQLAHVMAGKVPVNQMNSRFFAKLGLKGDEGKNLVPVDWLAEGIVYLVTHREHHGRTYHMASPKPVPVAEIQQVIAEAIDKHYPKPLAKEITEAELQALEGLFYEYMTIYESHWRDDPKFDLTNTRAALPHLPCPDMTSDVLMAVARYPVERNFMAPRHEIAPTAYDVAGHLASLLSDAWSPSTGAVGLQVNGPGGGGWQLNLDGARVVSAQLGLPTPAEACYYTSVPTFGALARGELSVAEAINAGRLVVDAPADRLTELTGVFQQLVRGVPLTAPAMN